MRGPARQPGGGERRGALVCIPLLLSALLLGGCGGLGINLGGGRASTGAHTVLLVRPGCSTFVARTLRHGFVVAEAPEGRYAPAAGDVLQGPPREGRSVFALFPSGAVTAGDPGADPDDNVPLDVLALGLDLPDASARLDAACPPS